MTFLDREPRADYTGEGETRMSAREQEHLKAELERLTGKAAQLRDDLDRVNLRIKRIRVDLDPIKVGSIVRERGKGDEFIIRSHEMKSSWCWYQGSKRKKDGSWADRTQRLFDPVLTEPTP